VDDCRLTRRRSSCIVASGYGWDAGLTLTPLCLVLNWGEECQCTGIALPSREPSTARSLGHLTNISLLATNLLLGPPLGFLAISRPVPTVSFDIVFLLCQWSFGYFSASCLISDIISPLAFRFVSRRLVSVLSHIATVPVSHVKFTKSGLVVSKYILFPPELSEQHSMTYYTIFREGSV